MKNNINVNNFANELSELIGQHIGLDHIHPVTEGRDYYTQAPKAGAPMLLHHYRGPFFIDIHPDDFENISSGKVSAHGYITSANWQVGYYWGGGSMVSGGYYQPLDLIGRRDEVRRYLQILSCRGHRQSCGRMPSEKDCADCSVENCTFSKYKEGKWDTEMHEPDPRRDLFKALCERFEQENPGYTLKGFFCGRTVPDGEIWIRPNGCYTVDELFAFSVYASNSLIQSLLMHENEPGNWTDYAKSFHFILTMFDGQTYDVTKETLEKSYEGLNFTKTQPEDDIQRNEKRVPLMMRIVEFFRKI